MNDALAGLAAVASDNRQETPLARDLEVGRRVIRAEIDGLRQLAGALDDAFGAALDLCAGASGRVIVTGMGKSGHVARKIAATFASTGTPAQFVHPAEASHGDLGMIGAGDLVIALSNSGNSAELGDIVAYSRRFKIPLVAITGDRRSTLAEAADVVIALPRAAEACSMGLTPTTSTTMMLALGDALAVALLEGRGFTAVEFANFHPGGKLGAMLKPMRDIMHAGDKIPLKTLGTKMADAIEEMTAKGFGCVVIVDRAGDIAGIITDGDLRRALKNGADLAKAIVDEVMTKNPKTASLSMLASEAVEMLNSSKITVVVVTDGNKPVGIVHVHDALRAGVA